MAPLLEITVIEGVKCPNKSRTILKVCNVLIKAFACGTKLTVRRIIEKLPESSLNDGGRSEIIRCLEVLERAQVIASDGHEEGKESKYYLRDNLRIKITAERLET